MEQNNLHTTLFDMAIENIPECMIPSELITINGIVNDIPIKILIDTGASTSIIFEDTIETLKIKHLVDKSNYCEISGIGKQNSVGDIYYIELNLLNNIYPISLTVINTLAINKQFDMILGLNFLQSYNAILNFKKKILILNNIYQIKFNN